MRLDIPETADCGEGDGIPVFPVAEVEADGVATAFAECDDFKREVRVGEVFLASGEGFLGKVVYVWKLCFEFGGEGRVSDV